MLINLYIAFSLPLDVARARTLWIRGDSIYLAAAFTSAISIKLLILVLEAFEKRGILLAEYSHYPPESTSGIYSRSFFWWLNPLLRDGFRKVLTNEDLYPIDLDMRSERVQHALKREWTKENNKSRKNALLWRAMWALRGPLAKAIIPRLCIIAFQFVQPFLITAVVNFVIESNGTQSNNVGWALTFAYGLDYVGLAIANGAFYHQTFRMVTIARGAIVSMIYSQTVDLNLTSVDESAALTLMSTDVERICTALEFVHNLWASFIEIAISVFLLQRNIGVAALGPAGLCLASGLFTYWLAQRFAAKAQMAWVQAIQVRVSATAKVLGGMKAVKMLGLTNVMASLLQQLRSDEVKISLRFRMLIILRVLLGKGAQTFAPGIAFAAIASISNRTGVPLNVAAAYSSLNIVSLMTTPLNLTIQTLPELISAVGCFDRIQAFLTLPAQKDHRLRNAASPSLPLDDAHVGQQIPLQNLSAKSSPQPAIVKVEHASFSWKEDIPVVSDVSFEIPRYTLTFVVGPVGSGKSTLLRGLLGETPLSKGFVYTEYFKAGFVDQTSWIQNGTVQSNVLAVSPYDRNWYEAVIHACCLQEDIAVLPKGDQTRVGSSGVSLSGGQKQRLVSGMLIEV